MTLGRCIIPFGHGDRLDLPQAQSKLGQSLAALCRLRGSWDEVAMQRFPGSHNTGLLLGAG